MHKLFVCEGKGGFKVLLLFFICLTVVILPSLLFKWIAEIFMFQIDLDKMPLGRLSKCQIDNAYKVLTELQDVRIAFGLFVYLLRFLNRLTKRNEIFAVI